MATLLETDSAPAVQDSTVYLKDYSVPDFLVPEIILDFVLDAESTTVTSLLRVERNGDHDRPLVLDGEQLKLLGVTLNGEKLGDKEYQLDEQSLVVHTDLTKFECEIVTQINPKANTALSGLYQSSGNFCTQCEAEGFRRITYFPDRPDVLSKYTVSLTADKSACPVLLSNGNPKNAKDNGNGTHSATWVDPHPKPSYLFALVAGDLQHISDTFTTMSGKEVALRIYTQAHNVERCDHAMASLIHSMKWDEDVYGREYDLDVYNIVAVDDFNMGAMENKGLNIFNSKYVLADQSTATDADFEGVESVIAHEYFHNWSGNRVTCRDWFQLSLKEGFTVFRDQEFSADMGSRAVKRIRDVQVLRAYQFKEDAGPMAHPIRPDSYQEINNFYTVTIYNKGAEVIRMLHSLVGADGFRKGTDLYFSRHDGQAVTTEEFVSAMEDANQVNLKQFRRWYTQAGTPEVSVSSSFDNGVLNLTLSQSCKPTPNQLEKESFQIPIKVALFSQDGSKTHEQTLTLSEPSQTFSFDGLSDEPSVSILRDFSAPIKLHFEQSDAALLNLIEFDDNGFTRWEAMQSLCLSVILPAIESGELNDTAYQRLRNAFERLLANPPQDQAIFAEMLTLPSTAYIAELRKPCDPVSTAKIRQECVSRLAQDLESQFHDLYASNTAAEFSLSGEAMAARSLKNRALSYLVSSNQAAYHAMASHQYHSANNMTDRLAAFTALVHADYPERQMLLDDFYQTWRDNPLVLDKWFAIQALWPSDKVLDEVAALMSNEAFSITNPNKVRSLIGAFSGNFRGFHRKDGAGYRFLADQVIALNSVNPQVAARLVGALNNWRHFSQPFRDGMRDQLLQIQQVESLTRDVSEIVSKALAD